MTNIKHPLNMIIPVVSFLALATSVAAGTVDNNVLPEKVTSATIKSPLPPRDTSLISNRPSMGVQQVSPPQKRPIPYRESISPNASHRLKE